MTWYHRELATPNLCACETVDLVTADATYDDGVATHAWGVCTFNAHGSKVTRP